MPRIALIHALSHSVEPINSAMAREWPDAVRMNLLDDSLSADLANSDRGLDDIMTKRFLTLAEYAVGTGAQGILFTCSAFGPCIEAVAHRFPNLPVLKPNEAMIADAEKSDGPIGLIATFPRTLESMPPEFPASVELHTALAEGALDALNRGDAQGHDKLIAEAAKRLSDAGCKSIALAQFSMARARNASEQATGKRVLTTVDSAVIEMKRRLSGNG